MLDPKGRVILISGAARGIGRAVAEVLHAKGYSVSLGVRDLPRAAPGFAHFDPERCHVARYDAEDARTAEHWIDEALERYGRIDGLVNNAGINDKVTLETADDATLDRLFAVNCKAPLAMIRLAMPHLAASGAGRIVNLASLSGKRVKNDNVGYAMTKFALMALTHAARRAGWDKGVRAAAVCPSFVATDMTAGATFARDQMIAPADLAELVATVIALPNTAAIAELLVNCRLEDTL